MADSYRLTSQHVMPAVKPAVSPGKYDIYPSFNIGDDKIKIGLTGLAEIISGKDLVLIDGYSGVFFEHFRAETEKILSEQLNCKSSWISTEEFLKPESEISAMVSPFTGGDDPLFGTRTSLSLEQFFHSMDFTKSRNYNKKDTIVIYGAGASLFSGNGFLVYLDLPKNEIQYRSRAGRVTCLGIKSPLEPKQAYKRFYFVDWVVLNRHKQTILEYIDLLADTQRPYDIAWIKGDDFRSALDEMSRNTLRVRPWFEPGSWGGSWIKENIPGLSAGVPNYAWSFELITPENGLIIESSGILLEFSFDFIMYAASGKILGGCHERFGTSFPIRFDFLDTFGGGNLSIQCHPGPGYTKSHFGEDFTQEETYYILDTKDNAGVYLGFCENIVKEEFEAALYDSYENNRMLDAGKYVQLHPARKHDLFLIPYGTVHGSGKNNLVLEISSTPYIFTFKLYDWLRPDLDGLPRQLNIDRGIENLFFERKGEMVKKELICKPELLSEGSDWKLYHLPTHPTHLYDIHRYHFATSVTMETSGKCLVCSLVEGTSVLINAAGTRSVRYSYAETFIIPAAIRSCEIINESGNQAMLVAAFVK